MNDWDIQVLARTIWGEARGEKPIGQRAVAAVIMNRVERRGQTVAGVCLARQQFSCWNPDDPNREMLIEVDEDADRSFMDCVLIATFAATGEMEDPTDGADHYFNPDLVKPSWADDMTKTATIGGHEFYKS